MGDFFGLVLYSDNESNNEVSVKADNEVSVLANFITSRKRGRFLHFRYCEEERRSNLTTVKKNEVSVHSENEVSVLANFITLRKRRLFLHNLIKCENNEQKAKTLSA